MKRQYLAIVALIAISSVAGSLATTRIVTAQAGTAQSLRSADEGNTAKWEYRFVTASEGYADQSANDLAGQGFALFKFEVALTGGDLEIPTYHMVFRRRAAA